VHVLLKNLKILSERNVDDLASCLLKWVQIIAEKNLKSICRYFGKLN